ncbi:MAG: UDP-glucose dehydrogenase family protein [Nitrosotalea sp.]
MSRISNISVVGLGKLGLCLAAVFASKGFNVTGIDLDKFKIDSVNNAKSPIFEPGLQELIASNKNRLAATDDFNTIKKTDATFVVVPTPSNEFGEFSLEFVRPVMEKIGKVLSSKDGYHLVVLSSTVMPGSMDDTVRPVLESSSKKKCGKDFGLCYNPEFIALGDVIRGFLEPDFILVGESDTKAGEMLSEIHRAVSQAPIERMNFVNAEIAKIAVNSFVTMKISFANTLAEICENLPGGDAEKITGAIGRDKRIGSAYLQGALGYGGPCFPRDNIAFVRFAEKIGIDAQLATATHDINVKQVQRIIKLIESIGVHPPAKVGVLGLTYKPKTNVTEASQPLMLVNSLSEQGFQVYAYDPAFANGSENVVGPKINLTKNAEDCIMSSDLCIIATPWDVFSKIDKSKFSNKIILDCWRIFGQDGLQNALRYFTVGRNPSLTSLKNTD